MENPDIADLLPEMSEKLAELKAQLTSKTKVWTKPATKKPATKGTVVKTCHGASQVQQPPKKQKTTTPMTTENPFLQKITNTQTALQSRALSPQAKTALEAKLLEYETESKKWISAQHIASQKAVFKKTPEPTKTKTVTTKPTVEKELTEVEIDGQVYQLDDCQKSFIKWHNEQNIKK